MKKATLRFLTTFVIPALVGTLAFQNCGDGFRQIEIQTDLSSTEMLSKTECKAEDASKLSETCLGLKPDQYQNLRQYSPQYPLYSNGAEKRRWIYLPSNTTVDTSELDAWKFPVGTTLWKEFSINGRKIETRRLYKFKEGNGPDSWTPSVYVWLADQSDAELAVEDLALLNSPELNKFEAGKVTDQYTLVSQSKCMSCHQGAKDVALGFNYLQLSDLSSPFNIETASKLSLLSAPPTRPDVISGNDFSRKAIGYLQTNCASCHSPSGIVPSISFSHLSTFETLSEEHVIKSAGQRLGLIVSGNPEESRLYQRMAGLTMPPQSVVRTHYVDKEGLQILNNWITSLTLNDHLPNLAPVADFNFNCAELVCAFSSSDTSSDPDGFIQSYSWAFGGDGPVTQANPTFTFPGDGGYTVSLTVTDDKGATSRIQKVANVTKDPVTPPPVCGPVNTSFGQGCTYMSATGYSPGVYTVPNVTPGFTGTLSAECLSNGGYRYSQFTCTRQ